VSGNTRALPADQVRRLLMGAQKRAQKGVERSIDATTGLMHTYYMGEPQAAGPANKPAEAPREYSITEEQMIPPYSFRLKPLPLFLEGQVHLLRLICGDVKRSRAVYNAVRSSELFDPGLGMYKLNASLDEWPPEIGRSSTFSRGWLENGSIWMHMAYKYLLELLRCGLYEEFFKDIRTQLVPFMHPAVYGRSLLENSSFIVPSDGVERDSRGRGFLARLSGSTAEFLHIWLMLTVGPQPFRIEEGELRLRLCPVLPGDWFADVKREVSWMGRTLTLPPNT